MNTNLKTKLQQLITQGYTHAYYPFEAGADFEKQIEDRTYLTSTYNDAVKAIEDRRNKSYESVQDSSFIWDLNEELKNL